MAAQSRRFAVLEVNGICQNLINLIEFTVDNNPACGLRKLTRVTAMNILHKMTIAAVNWRLAHNPYGDYEETIIETLFGPRPKGPSADDKALYRQISLNPLWCGITGDVERQVSIHIELDTYKDWKVVRVGSLIGLAEGQDYRITEYYRLNPEQRENDTAVITLDASNPVNYLLGQFTKEFGPRLQELANQNFNFVQPVILAQAPRYHQDIHKQIEMQNIQAHNQSMIVNNSNVARDALIDVYNNTSGYVAALFIDTLVSMYPMVELAYNAPRFNGTALHHLGVWNMDKFRTNYLQRVISAFGLSYFTSYLKKDKKYVLEYSAHNILAIYEKPAETATACADFDLLQSFINGDRLVPEEQKRAQALYEEYSRRGEI